MSARSLGSQCPTEELGGGTALNSFETVLEVVVGYRILLEGLCNGDR
jgi:hypothetical protein